VPKEDESLGALGPLAKLLQVVSPPALGAHQAQAARLDVVGLVADHTYVVVPAFDAINVTLAQLQARSLLINQQEILM
jgi:hypothetical protein